MLEVLAELSSSILYTHPSCPRNICFGKLSKFSFQASLEKKKYYYQSWEKHFGLIPFTTYVDVSVCVCVVGGEGGEGSTFNLPMGFPVGGKGIWNPWSQVGLQLLRIWGRQLQCCAGLWFGETWTELNRRKSWKRCLVAGPVPFMCEGQLCSCEQQCLDACKFIGSVQFLSLLWVRSEWLPSLNVCGEFYLRRVSSFAFAAEGGNKMAKYCCRQFCHRVWIETACERPWKATLLKQTTGRQGLLQADFASVPSFLENKKKRESQYVSHSMLVPLCLK